MGGLPERRREIALAGLTAAIDVLSAWRGRYEDDDRPAGIRFFTAVMPQMQADPKRGWLCAVGTNEPAIGWELGSQFRVYSRCRSFRGLPFTAITRGDVRAAIRKSGASLPACHATAGLDHDAADRREQADYDAWLKAGCPMPVRPLMSGPRPTVCPESDGAVSGPGALAR